MLPKSRRIPKKYFPYILSKSKRYHSLNLLLYVSSVESNLNDKQSRFSFSVAKKVYTLAVNRNKYRRQGFSVISKFIKQIKDGYFLFFSFKKSSIPLSFSVLDKEIKELLSLSGMLK